MRDQARLHRLETGVAGSTACFSFRPRAPGNNKVLGADPVPKRHAYEDTLDIPPPWPVSVTMPPAEIRIYSLIHHAHKAALGHT
jgi:hypothetical protein